MKQVRAKKSLGQHFLKDPMIADRIAASIEDYKDYPVVEVGPGMGVLTNCLIDRGFDLRVVELDRESIDYLQQHLPAAFVQENRIIYGDILRCTPESLFPDNPNTPFVMIGNYPYNISGRLFYQVFQWAEQIVCCAGMLQKEVAERITSNPGGRDYGILSVLLRSKFDLEYLFTVDKMEFLPPPKVHGGVLKMVRNKTKKISCDETLFIDVVKTAFRQRRKTLRNALKPLFGDGYAYDSLPDSIRQLLTLRAERLDVKDFEMLVNILEETKPQII